MTLPRPLPEPRSRAADIVRVASGNFLEMYDFMVFGYFAAAIGAAYFPSDDPLGTLLKSLATFGVGFLMRPLGAIILGSFTDRYGRRKGLLLTLALMSIGIVTLAVTPAYATIGVLAPVLILFGRLLQGFSAGAELGNVSVYLAEIAPPGHKGFYVSWQSASQQVAVVVAALVGVVLSSVLGAAQLAAWGWRIPLVLGCAVVPFIFLLRRHLHESDEFERRGEKLTSREIARSLWAGRGAVLGGVALVLMTTVSFYMITAYTPTFGKLLHLPERANLWVTAGVGLSNLIWLPLMGALSDRIGRRPILIACTVLAVLTAYPAMAWLVDEPSIGRLIAVELWLSAIYASYNSAMVVYLTEVVPASVRASSFSLAYSLATAVGGFTPFIVTWLIGRTGNLAIPGAWLTGAALISLAAVLFAHRQPIVPSVDGPGTKGPAAS
ncbi:tricarballylate/proton symporter TcuC [Polymorphobacter megasporae]|uniref:tricarballylate/proton symporter TcuC n=1 Tax=Glacieibacterium megasporae TaxID=2835787 RepID=UPI001C1DD0C1|nr:tricarballylate/proton symporter TcuC [Polymorphobacter megasporae]UAJ08954.1 tricarballylate/proton symporter TcuC [Polymorphobacter megasporae]